MIGEQILNYRVTATLGEGGMGAVYLAQHIQLGRQVAIKALHPNLVNNTQIRERFKNEAATMAHLQHNNIVSLYDYLEATNGLFLIMEYVQGKPLDVYIQQVTGPVPEDKATSFFLQILDGFDYAHNQGVVHRDIKPSNLVINPNNEVKILDFGIAKLLAGSNKNLTKDGSRMGTVLYMSPEQVRGQEVDRRSDIYSLGVTLFQVLTGRCPYDEETATEYDVYHQIVNTPLPRAKSFYPTVSDKMQRIIDKATAKNPDERFQSCAEFKRALQGQALNNLASTMPNPMLNPITGRTLTPEERDDVYKPLTKPQDYQNLPPRPAHPHTSSQRFYSRLGFAFFVLLILASGAFVALNPMDLELLRPYALYHVPLFKDKEQTIRENLQRFYLAVESRNFEDIAPFFAENVEDYFGNKNVKPDPDIKASYAYSWKKFISEKHQIDWESFEILKEDKKYIVKLKMRHGLQEDGKKMAFIKIQALIKLDESLQIFAIGVIKPKL